ncbi:MAG: putative membrane protein [Myxococcota bacterium]|jgi:putative membrane protein
MLVRPTRAFPGTVFLVRGTALASVGPVVIVLMLLSTVLVANAHAWGLERFQLTTVPFSLIGLALSIFLGFRNNACYDRWWEARKLWGALINTTRSLARQTATLVRSDDPAVAAFHRQQVGRTIAYAHLLRLHLRRQGVFTDVQPFVTGPEMTQLRAVRNPPITMLAWMGASFREAHDRGWVHPLHLPLLEGTLTDLTDIQGGCERIKNTPVPLSYTVLTHRIVGLYCFFLPLGILSEVGLATPLVVGIVSFAFLGLDAVGTQIEDPFEEDPNDLPLEALSRLIENDLRQGLGDTDLRPDCAPKEGILL